MSKGAPVATGPGGTREGSQQNGRATARGTRLRSGGASPRRYARSSTGIGAQVQKPLALVVVGGILLAPVLILVILPALIDVLARRERAAGTSKMQSEPAE
jgi:hypothetical protein